jgi:predicted ATPase
MRVNNNVFVGRQAELEKLESALEVAEQGALQICLIEGDAGDGKTALVEYFADEAREKNPKLSYAIGASDVNIGERTLYAPFKDIFAQLAGLRARSIEGFLTPEREFGTARLISFTVDVLRECAPELIGTLIPGAALLSRMALSASDKIIQRRIQVTDAGEDKVEQDEIRQQSVTFFQQRARKDKPIVLIFEDVQWIDKLSFDLLSYLISELGDAALLLVITYRPAELAAVDFATHLVNHAKLKSGTHCVNLRESRQERGHEFVEQFLAGNSCEVSTNFIDAFYSRTEGRPIMAVELLRFLKDAGVLVPNSLGIWEESADALRWTDLSFQSTKLDTLIELRLKKLNTEAREILRVASVEGYEFTAQVIASIIEMKEKTVLRTLSETLGREQDFVREVSEERVGKRVLSHFRFTNVWYQEHIYNSIGMGERRLLHDQIAQTLESLYEESVKQISSKLSHHYELGKNWNKAVDYLTQRGIQQAANAQYDDALETLNRALAIARGVDYTSGVINALGFLAVNVKLSQGGRDNYSEAEDLLEECISLAKQEGDLKALSYALRGQGRVLRFFKRYTEAMYSYMESLSLAKQLGDKKGVASCTTNIGVLASSEGRLEEAVFYAKKRLDLAKEMQDDKGRAIACMNLGSNLQRIAERDNRPDKLVEAAEMLDEAERINNRLYNLSRSVGIKILQSELAAGQGRYAHAADLLLESLTTAHQKDIHGRVIRGVFAFVRLMLRYQPEHLILIDALHFIQAESSESAKTKIASLQAQLTEQQRSKLAEVEEQEIRIEAGTLLAKVLPILESIRTSEGNARKE